MKYKKFLLAGVLILVLFVTGCQENPSITETNVEPLTITVNGASETSTLSYHIKNPLKFGFNGRIKILYEEDCLNINPDERDITVNSEEGQRFTSTITSAGSVNNLDNKCFDEEQSISVILYDEQEKNVLHSKPTKIALSRR